MKKYNNVAYYKDDRFEVFPLLNVFKYEYTTRIMANIMISDSEL